MSIHQRDGVARLDRVYERYVKPVEKDRLGEYVLVRPGGEMIFAALFDKTDGTDDWDNCIFKVGEIAATKILSPRRLGAPGSLSGRVQ